MTDKQLSKADQVAALRLARANRPKTSLELDAAFAVLLPKAKSSDGGGESRPALKKVGIRKPRMEVDSSVASQRHTAGVATGPSEANSGAPQTNATQPADYPNIKRGRPRIGETRDKPWLDAKPPMSERTWYRRQAEKREAGK